jgi:5-methylcytosine-specific restriction endonuclease McrA
MYWPPRHQALTNARVSRGKYRCAGCKELFGPKEVHRDHINPVVDPAFVKTIEEEILSMFSPLENYQILCKNCHLEKSIEENRRRRVKSKRKVTKRR